jgi:hypothetical protein
VLGIDFKAANTSTIWNIDDEPFLAKAQTTREIEVALFSASPDRTWGTVLQQQICPLFPTWPRQGKLPSHREVAKIIPLKKANKDDYTIPEDYRPISDLATLRKVMEAVVSTRIAYFTRVIDQTRIGEKW